MCVKLQLCARLSDCLLSNVEELNPTSTYTLRLIAIKDGVESEPSDVLTVDTQGKACHVTNYDSPYVDRLSSMIAFVMKHLGALLSLGMRLQKNVLSVEDVSAGIVKEEY